MKLALDMSSDVKFPCCQASLYALFCMQCVCISVAVFVAIERCFLAVFCASFWALPRADAAPGVSRLGAGGPEKGAGQDKRTRHFGASKGSLHVGVARHAPDGGTVLRVSPRSH
jgi:hypothetical protein